MKWMILGANGQLGLCAQDLLRQKGVEYLALTSKEVDICDHAALCEALSRYRPDVILNAAAYTAVDKAESYTDKAFAINGEAVGQLAQLSAEIGALLVHISTDYVFAGDGKRAYTEEDPVAPQSVYGASKLAGEQAIINAGGRAIILRTAWVFSEYGNNFLKTMLRLAQERDELGVVADQIGCPTYAGDIAQAAYQLVEQAQLDPEVLGLYHYCGDVAVSWWSFAAEIHRQGVQLGVLKHAPRLNAIPTTAYPTPAKRPAFSVMSCAKAAQYNVLPSDWKQQTAHVITQLRNS